MKGRISICCLMLACAAPAAGDRQSGESPSGAEAAEAEPSDQASGEQPVVAEDAPVARPADEPWAPRPEDNVKPEHELELVEHLDPFFAQLAKVDDGERKLATVVHFGASTIGRDDLPMMLRTKFQKRFGDGGAGLVLLQRYMSTYMHRSVSLKGTGWKSCFIGYGCRRDGFYGIGGATFTSTGSGRTTIATREESPGNTASRFELWYATGERGGKLQLTVDDGEPVVVDTRADAMEDRYHAIDVEPGAHAIRVQSLRGAESRAYGVLLETDGPGVVWDQFSMYAIFTKRLLAWDAEHIAGHIRHRDPHLLIFQYTGNDSRRIALGHVSKEGYVDEYVKVIDRVRAGKPEAACLIVGVTDRSKSLSYTIEPKHMKILQEAEREAAARTECALFDTIAAMGGPGSLKKWRAKGLGAPDQKHLNHKGLEIFAGYLYDALIAGYVAYRKRHG